MTRIACHDTTHTFVRHVLPGADPGADSPFLGAGVQLKGGGGPGYRVLNWGCCRDGVGLGLGVCWCVFLVFGRTVTRSAAGFFLSVFRVFVWCLCCVVLCCVVLVVKSGFVIIV